MKTVVIIILLGIHYGIALKCRMASCVGTEPCFIREVTCDKKCDHCFLMRKTNPIFTMARGCTTEANCLIMKAYEPSTLCCSSELCN